MSSTTVRIPSDLESQIGALAVALTATLQRPVSKAEARKRALRAGVAALLPRP